MNCDFSHTPPKKCTENQHNLSIIMHLSKSVRTDLAEHKVSIELTNSQFNICMRIFFAIFAENRSSKETLLTYLTQRADVGISQRWIFFYSLAVAMVQKKCYRYLGNPYQWIIVRVMTNVVFPHFHIKEEEPFVMNTP